MTYSSDSLEGFGHKSLADRSNVVSAGVLNGSEICLFDLNSVLQVPIPGM